MCGYPTRRRRSPTSTSSALDYLTARKQSLETELFARVDASDYGCTAARLRCLRGIGQLTAAGLVAEIGDFARFQRAPQLMSWVGLVPSEYSSGAKRRQGAITRAGSGHARRLLVEAAWNYRYEPRRDSNLLPARRVSPPTSSPAPGRPSYACTTSGSATTSAASAAPSPRSPSPASWDCPRICVGTSERDRHAYDYEKQDAEEQDQD